MLHKAHVILLKAFFEVRLRPLSKLAVDLCKLRTDKYKKLY